MAKRMLLTACLDCLYSKTKDGEIRFERKLVLLKRKQNTKANSRKDCWKVSGLNLAALTSVKLFWKPFSFFEGHFINLKQLLRFKMVFDSGMGLFL